MGVQPRASGRATIVDVARAAGVSRQTVSNALNAPERVAPGTLERVRAEIHRLHFTPNVTAQQLRRRRASAYGFAVNPTGSARMGHILDEFLVELTIAAPGHRSHLVTFAPDPGDVLESHKRLLSSGLVDGFVLADTRHGDPRPHWLLEQGVPFVSFGRIWDSPHLEQWVDVDGRAGMHAAVCHLAGSGYARVAFLGWPGGSAVGDDRRRGWLEGLEDCGLQGADLHATSPQAIDRATAAADRLIEQLGDDGAVLCASDLLALGVVRAINRRGLEPGRDVGVVGFDDTDVAEALQVSSVRQPLREAARSAWRLLHATGTDGIRPALLTPTLTVRGSSVRTPLAASGTELPDPSNAHSHPAHTEKDTP